MSNLPLQRLKLSNTSITWRGKRTMRSFYRATLIVFETNVEVLATSLSILPQLVYRGVKPLYSVPQVFNQALLIQVLSPYVGPRRCGSS